MLPTVSVFTTALDSGLVLKSLAGRSACPDIWPRSKIHKSHKRISVAQVAIISSDPS